MLRIFTFDLKVARKPFFKKFLVTSFDLNDLKSSVSLSQKTVSTSSPNNLQKL